MARQKSLLILQKISERLNQGAERFENELPLDDGRDWEEEALEELLDGMIYISNRLLLIQLTKLRVQQKKKRLYCIECGAPLGVDCGDAEPDYNEDFCSQGCYDVYVMRHNQ